MTSNCRLTAERMNDRTVLSDLFYSAPFKIMHPFYDGKRTKIIWMTASAGMLAGDDYHHEYRIGNGAELLVTGQGYTKVFNTRDGYCSQKMLLNLEENSIFRYLPRPVIPFAGSDFRGETKVFLERSSTLVYMDICAAGRTENGECFGMKRYANRLEVLRGEELIFLDNMVLDPMIADYRSIGFWGGLSHSGMMYLYTQKETESLLCQIRGIAFDGRAGATRAKEGILVRALGNSGDEVEEYFYRINELI